MWKVDKLKGKLYNLCMAERGESYKYEPEDVYPKPLEDALVDYYSSGNHLRLAREVVRLFNQRDEESQVRAVEGLLEAIDAHRSYVQLSFDLYHGNSTYINPDALNQERHKPQFCPDCSGPLNRVIISATGDACLVCGYSRF